MLDHAGVVPGTQLRRPGAGGEREERVEAERPVAARARIRRVPGLVGGDEVGDDGLAELLAQVERDVRQPERMASRPRGRDGVRRAADALRRRSGRVLPEAERDADRIRRRA